ncbi:MAG: VOC family protein [Bradyrhizobiaceae bacterium]|nr:MAG: VOC family protein [Bradyrhizobiaceae bacterium]
MANVFPCLWFKSEAEEALRYYVSIIKNSSLESVNRVGDVQPLPKSSVISATAILDGERVLAINGNPQFPFTMAMSMVLLCDTQKDIDTYWDKLSAGGQTIQCGWLTDKYGVAWQVVPRIFPELLKGDQASVDRMMTAMMTMTKLDIAALQKAYDGQ